jgi:Leucine-rich repeat (LRR) protein
VNLDSDAAPIRFPQKLRSLGVDMYGYTNTELQQQALVAIGALQQLESVTLRLSNKIAEGTLLAPLMHISSLTELKLDHAVCNAERVTELRSLTQLDSLVVETGANMSLQALLATPHQLRLTKLELSKSTTADVSALVYLPKLEFLWLSHCHMSDVSLLQQLPALRALRYRGERRRGCNGANHAHAAVFHAADDVGAA